MIVSEALPFNNYFGMEAEKVIVVTVGYRTMEMISRARNQLCVILVNNNKGDLYLKKKELFELAEQKGLVEIPPLHMINECVLPESGWDLFHHFPCCPEEVSKSLPDILKYFDVMYFRKYSSLVSWNKMYG